MRNSSASEDVCWSDSFVWVIILYLNCMIDCHMPKTGINYIFPMHTCMQDHGSCHVGYCLHCPLCNLILMMCISTTEMHHLLCFMYMCNTFVCLEFSTVCEVVLHHHSIVHTHFFKFLLSTNCLPC
jgi:hypothetical protein